MTDLTALAWPAARLDEAIEALARAAGLAPRVVKPLSSPASLLGPDDEVLGRWIAAAAGQLGLEAESTEMPYGEIEHLLTQLSPALLCLSGAGRSSWHSSVGGAARSLSSDPTSWFTGSGERCSMQPYAATSWRRCCPRSTDCWSRPPSPGGVRRERARPSCGSDSGREPLSTAGAYACHQGPASGIRCARLVCLLASSPSSAGTPCSTCSGCSPGG